MSYISSGSSSSGATSSSAGPSSTTSRSPSAEPSSSNIHKKQRRLTLDDIHIPAGFEVAKNLGEAGTEYPSEENIQKAAEVLQSLRGRMPDGSDGQVAACDYCRRRKIRCDRIKPTCGSCVASGRKCTTEDMLRKRGPPSKKERAILEAAGIIFRGTRPHRRRRTATTSLGSGAASKQQEEMLRKVKEAAGTRTRANSTNSGEPVTLVDGFDVGSKSSWMEMLSIATQSANPFADSPASSPSDISQQDTFHIDAGACDYLLPNGVSPIPARTAIGNLNSSAQWDNMWATFGADLRSKHMSMAEAAGPSDTLAATGGMPLPNLTAFACNTNDDVKEGLLRSSPLASFDAGALDWSASNITPSQYQLLFPQDTAAHHLAHQQQHDATMPTVHIDPQMMVPQQQQQQQQQQQHVQDQPFIGSQSSMAAEAIAFQAAMGHFFPKNHGLSSSLSHTSSSSSSAAEVSTPTELDQFISLADPNLHHHHTLASQQQQQQQQQQLQFSLAF